MVGVSPRNLQIPTRRPSAYPPSLGSSSQSVHRSVDIKAEVWLSDVPMASCKLSQKLAVNRESQSDTIDTGTLYNLTICCKYRRLIFSTKYVMFYIMKCAISVNFSIVTHIASWFFWDWGYPTTKSIVMCSHFHFGTGNGCKSPLGLWCSALTYWQIRNLDTKSTTSLFIPLYQNIIFKSLYIFVPQDV